MQANHVCVARFLLLKKLTCTEMCSTVGYQVKPNVCITPELSTRTGHRSGVVPVKLIKSCTTNSHNISIESYFSLLCFAFFCPPMPCASAFWIRYCAHNRTGVIQNTWTEWFPISTTSHCYKKQANLSLLLYIFMACSSFGFESYGIDMYHPIY